jgi:hypothetical protein
MSARTWGRRPPRGVGVNHANFFIYCIIRLSQLQFANLLQTYNVSRPNTRNIKLVLRSTYVCSVQIPVMRYDYESGKLNVFVNRWEDFDDQETCSTRPGGMANLPPGPCQFGFHGGFTEP